MANEALQFTRKMVEGKRICVEFEETKTDRYGALQGYVYIIGEDVFLNAEIIKQGYTPLVDRAICLRYQDLFKKLHEDIVSKSSGVWKQWMEINKVSGFKDAQENLEKEKLRIEAIRKFTRFMTVSYYVRGK